MALLDPKLDVVFKLLFAEPRNRALLVSLLTAVLRPNSPIANVTVLDPELPKDLVLDRGVRLDLLVELSDGRLVDVEMQTDPRGNRGDRWLYHWARLFAGRLRRGDEWSVLEPVVAIVFLDDAEPSGRFHSVYEVREVHDHTLLTDALQVHLIELPRLEQAVAEGEREDLRWWARFLRAESEPALESLATEVPLMAAAKEALELLSREPSAQRLAQYREDAAIERRLDRAADRKEGRAEGLVEGRAEGLREGEARGELHGRRAMMRSLLEGRFGVLPAAVLDRVESATADDLAAWLGRALSARTLDEVVGAV